MFQKGFLFFHESVDPLFRKSRNYSSSGFMLVYTV